MSSFAPVKTKLTAAQPDPTKHVNYTLGMVLGEDDFKQEFAYLTGRDQWLARDLIGYGTVSGLEVTRNTADNKKEIVVHAGVALSPVGQLIRVPCDQCADLEKWSQAAENKAQLPVNGQIKLYVVLCYRECPTDYVPIPGEPCRSEADSQAASRWADDFELKLSFIPPAQCEEDALRDFVEWLRRGIEFVDIGGSSVSLEDFLNMIRDAALAFTSPPCSDFMTDSPPLSVQIAQAAAGEYLRAAFRLWTTELRHLWRPDFFAKWHGCSGAAQRPSDIKLEECVLLAELDVPFTAGVPDVAQVAINQERRPYLLHLRMLQEWLLDGLVDRTLDKPLALDDLIDVEAPIPEEGDLLVYENGRWVAKVPEIILSPPESGVTDHGALTGLANDDHRQYLPVNPLTRALANNLNGGGFRITNLAAGAANGDAVIFQQAIKTGQAAGGDLAATYPNPQVARLRGRTVANTAPTIDNQVLAWNNGATQWEPRLLLLDSLSDVNASSPLDGDLLMRAGANWIAAPLVGFVQAVNGPYAIVAAGRFDSNGVALGPTYNNMTVTALSSPPTEYVLNFQGYANPESASGKFMYIIKGTAIVMEDSRLPGVFEVVRFQNNGIRVRVVLGNGEAHTGGFMVEISHYTNEAIS